jgi:CubicO group peptidase (beta-lactamase class C family)
VRNPGDALAASPGVNRAPIVDAGEDVTISWPEDSVELQATVVDDGLPANGKLRLTWLSSSPEAQIETPMSAKTLVRLPAPGIYTMTLAADDGAVRTTDAVTITVVDDMTVAHEPPSVDAGADQTVELPFPIALRGVASDDLLTPSELTAHWSMVSGPGEATFGTPDALDTTLRLRVAGAYELALEVSDGDYSTRDTLIINATPAIYPAPDLSDVDPDRGWLRVNPAEVGLDAALLLQAEQYASAAGGSLLISRHGRLVHSWNATNVGIDTRFDVKSVAKSIGSIALALALDEERVQMNDRAVTHLPTFGLPPASNDPQWLSDITLLQLATHTAGFEKTGGYGRVLTAPGTQWRYSDGALNWLADTLTTVFAQDLHQMFAARLYPVLGINERDDIQWRRMSSGTRPAPRPNGLEHREFASGFAVNTNTMARIGLLFLRGGEWENNTRVFSESFVDFVRTPHPDTARAALTEPDDHPDATQRYGVMWWTNATGALPEVPRDAYWAWGLGDSLIVVIPSLDLVIARAGNLRPPSPTTREFGDNDWDGNYEVLAPLLNPIVQAVRD